MLDWKESKILVVGDIILNRYIYPDFSNNVSFGGAANVANNIILLGAKSVLAGVVGYDEFADKVWPSFDGPIKDKRRTTNVKSRWLSFDNNYLFISEEGSTFDISDKIEDDLCNRILVNSDVDAVIISDYGKGVVTNKIVKAVQTLREEINVPLIISPKFSNFTKYCCSPDLLVPYVIEIGSISNLNNTDFMENIDLIAKQLFFITKSEYITITKGENGSVVYKSGKLFKETKGKKVENYFCAVGSEEVYLAVMGLGMSINMNIGEVAKIADIAASLSIQYKETCNCLYKELIEEIKKEGK